MVEQVEIFEVGPRDGLQNEARHIATEDKVRLVDLLSGAGYRRIECASFVSPKWVPQMADSDAVLAGIARKDGVSYAALTPNEKGFERAMAAKADEVAVFGAASEGFSRANINASIEEGLARFVPVMAQAQAWGISVRGYVSCVVECPYDGSIAPQVVARVVAALRDMGCYEVSLGDTIGQGRPEAVDRMLGAVLQELPADRLAGHFHDTAGRALENIDVALERGLRVFDASIAGLGGCPYAPGASGNVASEAVHDFVQKRGFATGIRREILTQAADLARSLLA